MPGLRCIGNARVSCSFSGSACVAPDEPPVDCGVVAKCDGGLCLPKSCTVYLDQNYGGSWDEIPAGTYKPDLGSIFGDEISSIQCVNGAKITLWKDTDKGGWSVTLQGQVPNLSAVAVPLGTANDAASSLEVQ